MKSNLSAIVLAAGLSSRMGQPKLLLPWEGSTVLGTVLSTLSSSGVDEILVVTGAGQASIEDLIVKIGQNINIHTILNPQFSLGSMLSSIQVGLTATDQSSEAALITLGDQPQVHSETIRLIMDTFHRTRSPLVVPSFQNHRGHPWLVANSLWKDLLDLPISATPRQFLHDHAGQIEYVLADESIMEDLDTPQDYARQQP